MRRCSNSKFRPELLAFRVKPQMNFIKPYQPMRVQPKPHQCCRVCQACGDCLCLCQPCMQNCQECGCQEEEALPVQQPSHSSPDCRCGVCSQCKGCVCDCSECSVQCDLCICPDISQAPCAQPKPKPCPQPDPRPCPPPKPNPPPKPSSCQPQLPCNDYNDCHPNEEFEIECVCSSCEHCEGCRCKCRVCRQNCTRCTCSRQLKDPRICATSRVVDQGYKNKYVFIMINICSRSVINNFQIYLDLQSAFTDGEGRLVCLDKDDIGISAAPLEINQDYNGKSETKLLAECQRFQPGNMKITINLSGIPSNWCINPMPITTTGKICNQQIRISTCVEGEECC